MLPKNPHREQENNLLLFFNSQKVPAYMHSALDFPAFRGFFLV